MGWLFEDKLGGTRDTAAPYYRARLAEQAPPPDAEAFAARVGFQPDWHLPHTHALYWYHRARHNADTLRALTALLRQTGDPTLLPFFAETVRAVLPELAPSQADQLHRVVQELRHAFPNHPALNTLFKEPQP